MKTEKTGFRPSRRGFLAGISTLSAMAGVPTIAKAGWSTTVVYAEGMEPGIDQWERRLSLINQYTGESVNDIYWQDGSYNPQVLEQISWVLRDHNNDTAVEIAPQLLDLMNKVRLQLDTKEMFEVTSAYRSPETNKRLVRKSGAARNSLHLHGLAVDCHLPGVKLSALSGAAKGLKRGGVGYYPRRGTVHLDVGPVRSWRA